MCQKLRQRLIITEDKKIFVVSIEQMWIRFVKIHEFLSISFFGWLGDYYQPDAAQIFYFDIYALWMVY